MIVSESGDDGSSSLRARTEQVAPGPGRAPKGGDHPYQDIARRLLGFARTFADLLLDYVLGYGSM